MIRFKFVIPAVLLMTAAFYATAVADLEGPFDYWTYAHQYLPTTKSTYTAEGTFNIYDPDYGYGNIIVTSPGDDTFTPTYSIANKNGVSIRPDAFSLNSDVGEWLNTSVKGLLFSVAQIYDENGPTFTKYGSNDDVYMLENGIPWGPYVGTEALIKHVEPLVFAQYPAPPNTLGVPLPDYTLGFPDLIVDNNGWIQGRSHRGNELALADFDVTDYTPDPDERIYFSAGRRGNYTFGGGFYGIRPGVSWKGGTGANAFQGSDYFGNANAGDILTVAGLASDPSYGIFEYAWKIAGTMLGDKFWLPANGSLVWNNMNGYVSTSTSSLAAESAGHDAIRNFLHFIFDITAMKVEDVNGNGKFDSSTDKVLFTLANDTFYTNGMNYWGRPDDAGYQNIMVLKGQFFPGGLGDAIFLYDSNGVSTYMDRGTNMYFGTLLTTTNATIWGEKWGEYDITGFDITTYIPEPSALILIVGAGLASAAGFMRRRIKR